MLTERRTRWATGGILMMLIAAFMLAGGCEDPTGGCGKPKDPNFCLKGIRDYTPGQGPFSVEKDTDGIVKMWVPDVPEGCKVPIVHLANGTGGRCIQYAPILNNLARYGFLAVCYDDMNTGMGNQAITAVNKAIRKYSNIADSDKIGFTGHSQGGGGAILAIYRAEQDWGTDKTYSGLAMQPASGLGVVPPNWASMYRQVQSPISMFNGSDDVLVPGAMVRITYNALPNVAFKVWYTANGDNSQHVPPPYIPTQAMSIPWFRWTLLDDARACEAFKALPDAPDWTLKEAENMPECR